MSGTRLRVLSWNMNQQLTSWSYLQDLAVRYELDVALLQEARLPSEPPAVRCEPDFAEVERWQVPVPVGMKRPYCSAVVCFNRDLNFEPVRPTPLWEAPYGGLAASHPGQFAVATVTLPGHPAVTVVSLYGLWDKMNDSGEIYAYATLHRALSDLTPLFQTRGARVIVAGDLNVWHGYGGPPWLGRYQLVFDRLASQGLELVGPFRPSDDQPLENCPCGPQPDCRHVLTYRHQRNAGNRPYQNDFVFAGGTLAAGAIVTTVREEEVWRHSDHVPVIAEFSIEEETT